MFVCKYFLETHMDFSQKNSNKRVEIMSNLGLISDNWRC